MKILSALALALCVLPAFAAQAKHCGRLPYAGRLFVDLGSRTHSQFCAELSRSLDSQGLVVHAVLCIWLKPGAKFEKGRVPDKYTFAFRPVHGAVYLVRYNSPTGISAKSLEPEDLEKAGIHDDRYTCSIVKAVRAARYDAIAAHVHGGPDCRIVVVSGFAAAYPDGVRTLYASDHPRKLLAYSPLVCERRRWGGRSGPNGALMGGNTSVECHGGAILNGQRGRVMAAGNGLLRIRTEVDFNTGRRPVLLFVRQKDAACPKK